MRIGEIDGDAGDGRQVLVTRHLFSLTVAQRLAHLHVHAIENASKARERGLGGCTLHASEQNQAVRALDQGANRGLIARTLDQIAFPMTGNEAILDLGGRTCRLSISEIWPRRSWPRERGRRLARPCRRHAIRSLRKPPRGMA
jgi:hypothetical protein